MAMGKAVVVSKSGGLRDAVKDNLTGVCVSPGSPLPLRRAIAKLINDPEERRRLGRNARKQIEKQYSLDRYVENLAHIIQGRRRQARSGEKLMEKQKKPYFRL